MCAAKFYQDQYYKVLSKPANNLQKHENKPIQQLSILVYVGIMTRAVQQRGDFDRLDSPDVSL